MVDQFTPPSRRITPTYHTPISTVCRHHALLVHPARKISPELFVIRARTCVLRLPNSRTRVFRVPNLCATFESGFYEFLAFIGLFFPSGFVLSLTLYMNVFRKWKILQVIVFVCKWKPNHCSFPKVMWIRKILRYHRKNSQFSTRQLTPSC